MTRRMPVQWSVRVELAGAARDLDPDVVSDVLEALEDSAAVASLSARSLGIRLCVDASEVLAAASKAAELVDAATRARGLSRSEWPIVGIAVATMDDLADELAQPNAVPLAGVAELAAVLGVSKQRASELARSRTFPKPLVTLASGPVWAVAAVESFSRTWSRRPGPKPSGAKPAQPVAALSDAKAGRRRVSAEARLGPRPGSSH
jgi:hypothetical protein